MADNRTLGLWDAPPAPPPTGDEVISRYDFEEHTTRLAEEGYTIVRSALDPRQCAEAREALLRLASSDEPLTHLFNRGEAFEAVYTSAGGQFVLRVARHFLGEDATLSDIAGTLQQPGGSRQGIHVRGPNPPTTPAR